MVNPNPFEVLGLDPTSSEALVVEQGGRLRQRGTDEATLTAIRQAVQALTGQPDDRSLHSLLAHPQPVYAWPALDKLGNTYRRAPVPTTTPVTCPPFDRAEFLSLLRVQLANELELSALQFEALRTAVDENEIEREAAEALWQSLVCDPRA
jgi:hypothetical protein